MAFDWTVEGRDDALVELYIRQDLTAGKTAKELGNGCTASAVRGRAKRLGLQKIDAATTRTAEIGDTERFTAAYQAPGKKAAVLADLEPHQCRWPVGHSPPAGEMDRQLFCGEMRDGESRYCRHHSIMSDPKRAKGKG